MSYSELLISALVVAAAIVLFVPLGVTRKGNSSARDEVAKIGSRSGAERGDVNTGDAGRRLAG